MKRLLPGSQSSRRSGSWGIPSEMPHSLGQLFPNARVRGSSSRRANLAFRLPRLAEPLRQSATTSIRRAAPTPWSSPTWRAGFPARARGAPSVHYIGRGRRSAASFSRFDFGERRRPPACSWSATSNNLPGTPMLDLTGPRTPAPLSGYCRAASIRLGRTITRRPARARSCPILARERRESSRRPAATVLLGQRAPWWPSQRAGAAASWRASAPPRLRRNAGDRVQHEATQADCGGAPRRGRYVNTFPRNPGRDQLTRPPAPPTAQAQDRRDGFTGIVDEGPRGLGPDRAPDSTRRGR